ncbi:MAG: hypothetical protein CM15mP102_11150 [Flavobacteriales bacterium]|nr:MAG: hypothetical protein CM15mP102_11150 [Flavobacteriales bacterium]
MDIIQIPAFLARQTDILVSAAKTGKVINIKKGQFMSSESMKHAVDKVVESGNQKVMLTERGTQFGYNDLIVDFRGISELKNWLQQYWMLLTQFRNLIKLQELQEEIQNILNHCKSRYC